MHYRKIYEQQYGHIPQDEDGRSYDVHHIDGNHNNDSPENLKAISIQEHYDIHYTQKDFGACHAIALRLKLSPHEISKLAKEQQKQLVASGAHHLLGPASNLKRVKDRTHPFLTKANGTSYTSDKIKNGTHHFITNNPGKNKVTRNCPYCSRDIDYCNYAKYHGEQCKLKPK
jgi:hypothetical protein